MFVRAPTVPLMDGSRVQSSIALQKMSSQHGNIVDTVA